MAHGWIKLASAKSSFLFFSFILFYFIYPHGFILAPTYERVGLLHILLFYFSINFFYIFLSSCDLLTLDEIGRIKKTRK